MCYAPLTSYAVHGNRGRETMATIGLLASSRSTLVHA
jgi:hypothetical protein